MTEIEYQIIGPITNINLWYYDIDGNFPIVAEVITNSGNIYQMFPLSFDYTEPVEFFTEIPENDWNEITVSFSDNGFEFVEHVIQNTDAEDDIIQSEIRLSNYPNPFNPSTTISFTTEQAESTETCPPWRIEIYNIKGQKIKTLAVTLSGVEGSATWNGTDDNNEPVSSGIYFYKLKAGDLHKVKRMILLK